MSLFYTDGTFVYNGNFYNSGLNPDAYLCLCCLKILHNKKRAVTHEKKCNINLPEGVNIITKEYLKGDIRKMINNFGRVSSFLQKIDTPVTYDWNIKENDFTLFVFVLEGRPVGLLTTDLNKERKIIGDFAVLPHLQRQGIGKKLVDAAIEYAHTDISEWAFSSPSNNTIKFLHKWYKLEKIWTCR